MDRIKKITIDVKENGKYKQEKITVEKVPLGKWKNLIDTVKRLFKVLPEVLEAKGIEDTDEYMETMTMQDLIMLLPDMLEVAAEEIFNLLSIGSGLSTEYIEEKVGLDEAVELFEAIIEVNNLIKVAEKGKNLISLWKTQR